jgi:hypothetical protein
MRTPRRLLFVGIMVATMAAMGACGSRTGLLVPLDFDAAPLPPPTADAKADHILPRGPDEGGEDAEDEDALPPIDVRVPDDVIVPNDCPDAAATFIYVISESNNLYSFYPPSGELNLIGTIACPDPGSTPFSMAVDRTGIAYVVFSPSGNLFRVTTATAACEPTTLVPNANFGLTYGMGFSQNDGDAGETLYVASDTTESLGTIDVLNGYTLNTIGPFNPPISQAELTGTGAGELFGFWQATGPSAAIVQIDKTTAQVTNSSFVTDVQQGTGWAFAFWGGEFYTFTAPNGNTVVNRFNPADNSVVQVATVADIIVGAGVSTCAPQK